MKKTKYVAQDAVAMVKGKYDALKIGAQRLVISAKNAGNSALNTGKNAINSTKIKANNLLQKLGIRNLSHPINAVSDKDVEAFVYSKLNLVVFGIARTEDRIQVNCMHKDRNITLYLGDYEASAVFEGNRLLDRFEKTLAEEITQKWTFILYQVLGKQYLKNLSRFNHETANLEVNLED